MTNHKKITTFFWIFILCLIFIFKIGMIYYGYYHKHYLVPPGNDVVAHYTMIQAILKSHSINLASYPPGFHLLVILLNSITHVGIWTILTKWTPVLIFLPSLTMFFLLRQFFSLRVSVISIAILLLTSAYPMYAFVDGNYPDMLAYGVFSILLFIFLIRYFKSKNWINLLGCGILLFLILLTHNFTFFNILAILSLFAILQLLFYLWRVQIPWSRKILVGIGFFLLILAVGYLLATKLYGSLAINFIYGLINHKAYLIDAWLNTPLDITEYPRTVGELVWYLGIAGIFVALISRFKTPEKNYAKQLALIWLCVLYLLSRFGASGIPARFTRELALPLIIFIGFLFDYLIDKNPLKSRIGQIFALGLLGFVIIINSELYIGLGKLPDSFDNQVWYWPVDAEKVQYLKDNIDQNSIILYNPSANPFFVVKSQNKLLALQLNSEQIQTVRNYEDYPDNKNYITKYQEMLNNLKKIYQSAYIFDDNKPPGNTSNIYPIYQGFAEKKKVIEDLAHSSIVIKTFEDNSVLYKTNASY